MADPRRCSSPSPPPHAVEHVGLPEAQLNLAQAVVHLATAPKSNRAALASGTPASDVRDGPVGEVPAHLRDATTRAPASIGHGAGYEYPHDHPRLGAAAVPARRARRPSLLRAGRHGFEAEVARRQETARRGRGPSGQADGEDPVGGSAG